MAVVRLTKEIKDITVNNANNTFNKRIDAAHCSLTLPMTGDEIYNLVFAQWLPHMNALPKEFFSCHNKIEVRNVHDMTVNHTFILSDVRPFPQEFPESELANRFNSYGNRTSINLIADDKRTWAELYYAFKSWKDRVETINTERLTFANGVRAILENNTTLAAALREWPPLWDLVPEFAKNKHKQIADRKSKDQERPTPEVDTARLTAMAALNKML